MAKGKICLSLILQNFPWLQKLFWRRKVLSTNYFYSFVVKKQTTFPTSPTPRALHSNHPKYYIGLWTWHLDTASGWRNYHRPSQLVQTVNIPWALFLPSLTLKHSYLCLPIKLTSLQHVDPFSGGTPWIHLGQPVTLYLHNEAAGHRESMATWFLL